MKFVWSLAGYTPAYFKGNTEIRNQPDIYNLKEEREKKKAWHEHILRMDENRPWKILLNYKPERERDKPIGRPLNKMIKCTQMERKQARGSKSLKQQKKNINIECYYTTFIV
jgi:hypothetical protein